MLENEERRLREEL